MCQSGSTARPAFQAAMEPPVRSLEEPRDAVGLVERLVRELSGVAPDLEDVGYGDDDVRRRALGEEAADVAREAGLVADDDEDEAVPRSPVALERGEEHARLP